MKNRKLIMGLVASAWVLGGCLVEPLDEDAGEDLGTVTEAMSADRTGAPSGEDPQDESTSESAGSILQTAAGQVPLGSQQSSTAPADPNKPQPDPWDGTQQRTTSTTVNR